MSSSDAHFVGRQELLGRLLQELPSDDRLRADVVTGVLGMGKSTLLRQAAQLNASPDGTFDALYLDLADHAVGGRRDHLLNFGAAVQDYENFSNFVTTVVTRLAPEGLSRLEDSRRRHRERFREVKALILNVHVRNDIGAQATVTSSGTTVNMDGTPRAAVDASYIQESRSWIEEERDILVNLVTTRRAERPALLLLDNVDAVVGYNFSDQLALTLSRLAGAVAVLAQEPGTQSLLPGASGVIPVPPLKEGEVRELLEARLVAPAETDQLAPLVHRFSGGVPVAVEILVDLLNDEDEGMEAAALEERLRRMPRDPGSRLAEVVTTMEEHYHGRPLGVALRAASVPDRCDAPLLASLLPAGGVPGAETPELLKDLGALSATAESAGGEHYVEVHPFIRRGLLESMRKFRPTELARYHEIVADHYYQMFTGSDSYGEMFDIEDPRSQELRRQWLRHLGEAADVQTSMLQAARVFFDAMWWWGNYVEFDFCETLATSFEAHAESAASESFAQFAAAVRLFLENYPFRARYRQDFEHGYPAAGWDIVQDQLLNVQDLCGLLTMPAEPSRLESHVKALTETFLAHTHRYAAEPDHEQALACYDRAADHFGRLGRWWDLPWVTFESADVTLESGDVAGCRDMLAVAVEQFYEHLDPADPDEELLANMHRLRADCAWQQGDVLAAAKEHGLAVLHSYLFHLVGGPPDDYTMQHYFEIRGRALQRLTRMWSRGQEDLALTAALEMRHTAWAGTGKEADAAAVATALREGRDADLALVLFPRGPDVAELGEKTSPFKSEVQRFRHRVGDSTVRDLAEALAEPVLPVQP